MKTLSMLIPIKSMRQRAEAFALYILGRWDVPQGGAVPDLADKRGLMGTTPDGRRISGLLLVEDNIDNSIYNPVVAVLAGLFPLLTLLIAVPKAFKMGDNLIGMLTVISMALVAGLVWFFNQNGVTKGRIFGVVALGYLVPLLAFGMIGSTSSNAAQLLTNPLAVLGGAIGRALMVAGVGLVVLWVISFFSPKAKEPLSTMMGIILLGGFGVLFLSALSPVLRYPACYALACLAPWWLVKQWKNDRGQILAGQGNLFTGEGNGTLLSAHIKPRIQQYEQAFKDTSPTIYIGEATGILNRRNDPYAPDEGLPIVMSANDSSTHILVLGETGSRKTAGFIRPYVVQWMLKKCGGVFLLDGKNDLALEFVGIPGYQVITPSTINRETGEVLVTGTKIALLQGMQPGLVSETLSKVMGGDKDKGSKETGSFFTNNALTLGRHAENLVWWLVRTEEGMRKSGEVPMETPRQWHWTISDVLQMINMLADTSKDDAKRRKIEPWLGMLSDHCPVADRDRVLNAAISYAEKDVLVLAAAENTWSNIVSTVKQWYEPLLAHHELIDWAECESSDEVDLSKLLFGGNVGVYLPLQYGKAGEMACALLRQNVADLIRKRPKDWANVPGAKPLLVVMDEAQELLNPGDLKLLSMGRSQGCHMLSATQSIDALVERLGENATDALVVNYLSRICLRSSHATYQFMQEKLGKVNKPIRMGTGQSIDYCSTVISMLNSPMMDWEHPYHSRKWEHQVSQGALSVLLSPKGNSKLDYVSRQKELAEYVSHTDYVTTGKFQESWLLDDADFAALSKAEGYAVVSVMRGGQPRRDLVQLKMMYRIPVELFQQST